MLWCDALLPWLWSSDWQLHAFLLLHLAFLQLLLALLVLLAPFLLRQRLRPRPLLLRT